MSHIEELLITIGIIIGIVILMLLLVLFCGLINFLFNNKNKYIKDDEITNEIFIEK